MLFVIMFTEIVFAIQIIFLGLYFHCDPSCSTCPPQKISVINTILNAAVIVANFRPAFTRHRATGQLHYARVFQKVKR